MWLRMVRLCECACQQSAHLVPVVFADAKHLAQERREALWVALQDSDNVLLATEAGLDDLSELVGLVGLRRTSLVVRLFNARDNTKKRERARAVADGEMV